MVVVPRAVAQRSPALASAIIFSGPLRWWPVAISKLQGHASDLEGDAHRVHRLGVKVLAVEKLYIWYGALPSPNTGGSATNLSHRRLRRAAVDDYST